MKNLKLGISALALTIATTVFAQTTSNPWLIGVGAHGVNHKAVKGSMWESMTNFKTGLHLPSYTITPPLSKLTVARNLNKYFVLDWQTSVGNVDNKRIGMDKEFFLMTGLGLQFKFNGLWNENSWFDPYLRIGGNYMRHDYSGVSFPTPPNFRGEVFQGFSGEPYTQRRKDHFTVAGGLGSNFWLTKNFGLGLQGDYVTTPIDKSNIANFWHGSASILFRFGNTDRDKDGILDKDDLCPDTFGLAQFQGCPDTGGDGIPDKDDKCPEVAGPADNQGCPWPDTDGDGVLDKDDQCPTVAGPAANNGCPWPDTDGDGILDKDDACPTVPGLKEYNGCPKPQEAFAGEAELALKNILFNFNKATLRPEAAPKLDEAAKVIKESNGGTFLLVGHTDKKGNDAYNLKLSRERAASVVAALEARGVAANQLKSKGVGEAFAKVPETASDAERLADRKVEVKYVSGADWDALQKSDVPAVKKAIKRAKVKKAVKKKK